MEHEKVTLDSLVRDGARIALQARVTRLTEPIRIFLSKSPEPPISVEIPDVGTTSSRPKTEELGLTLNVLENGLYALFEADAEAAGLKAFLAKVRALPEPRKVSDDEDFDDVPLSPKKKSSY
jgi:hypothetical protein